VRGRLVLFLALLLLGSGACSQVQQAASGGFEPATTGTLTVATELPAPGFWDGDDPATVRGGFEWGLAAALADELGLDLAVRAVPFPEMVAGRLHGADLALAQVSATKQRSDAAELTLPYYQTSPTALALPGTEDDLVDLATAKEQRWVVQQGTTLQGYLEDVVRPDQQPLLLATTDAVVRAVVGGQADVALLDLPTALNVAAQRGLAVPARFGRVEQIVGVLPAGSGNLGAVDKALHRLLADGTVDDLVATWLDPVFAVDPDDVPVITAQE
jgi:polar amino acid transport system substrate-binding protein